mgnify:CR=1 FL=1
MQDIGGIRFIGQLLDGLPVKELRPLADAAKQQIESGVVAFVAVNDGKAALLVGVTDDLTGRFNAVDLVRVGAEALGGSGGGGRPGMAQAGGPDGAAGQTALDAVAAALRG